MEKWAHVEALPIVSAQRSMEGMKTMPHQGAHPTARPTTPKCRERCSRRCLPKPMRKRAHAEALPIFFGGGRHSIGGMTNQASPRRATNRHAHDPQVSGAPLAASFAQPHEETGLRRSAAHLLFWGGGVPSGGRPTKPPPGVSPTAVPPTTGKPFAASFVHLAAGPLLEEAVRAQGHRGAPPPME